MGLTEEEELELLELENENERLRLESQKPKEPAYQKTWGEAIAEPLKDFRDNTANRFKSIGNPTVLGEAVGASINTPAEKMISMPIRKARTTMFLGGLAGDAVGLAGDVGVGVGDKLTGGKISSALGTIANKTGLASLAAKANSKYNSLPASAKTDLSALGAGLSALGVGGGGKLGSIALKAGLKKTLKSSVDNVTGSALKNTTENIAEKIPKLEDVALKDIKKGTAEFIEQADGQIADVSKVKKIHPLVDLEESHARILHEKPATATIPFGEYVKQATTNKKNLRALTPAQLAATNATNAFKEIDNIKRSTGEGIEKIIAGNAHKKIDISSAKNKFLEAVDERIGGLKKGEIMSDPSVGKAIEDIGNTLLNLSDEIDPKTAQRLKQNLRQKLKYDSVGQLRPKNSVLDGILKETTNLIDRKMDSALEGFKEANDRYRDFAKIEDALSRALGSEFIPGSGLTKHGASIMKRVLQSNADSNIGDIFRQVKELTNGKYDLFQDATYANIAMRLSGDATQVSKASPFGALPIFKGNKGGGAMARVSDAVIDKGKDIVIENEKLNRILNWYNKKHYKPDLKELAKMKQFVKK